MWGVPSGAEIAGLGLEAQGVYVPFNGDGGKGPASRAVLQDLTDHNIYYWWVYENNPQSPLGGASNAETDFSMANQGLASLGINAAETIVYYAMDAIVTDQPAFMAYFTAIGELTANQAPGGIYGSGTCCEWVVDVVKRYWQTGAGSTSVLPWAHIYQGAPQDIFGYPQFQAFGTTCDADAVWSTAAGLANLNGPWPSDPPGPPIEERNMVTMDPVTGGYWMVNPDGAVYSNAVSGSGQPPYLGGLNNHPEYKAGGKAANGPAVGIAPYGPGGKGGYVIVTFDGRTLHPYQFPRDGSLAHAN
jgi:hypothetical protein